MARKEAMRGDARALGGGAEQGKREEGEGEREEPGETRAAQQQGGGGGPAVGEGRRRLPLLVPSGPRSTVHSSMVPKGSNIFRTSSSVCCFPSIPTKSFRSSGGEGIGGGADAGPWGHFPCPAPAWDRQRPLPFSPSPPLFPGTSLTLGTNGSRV